MPRADEPESRVKADRKASASVRVALVFYAMLVIYASCFPFSGWHDNGLLPWSYLGEPMPHYWTGFDLAVNVIGYVPLGALAVLAMYPRLRGTQAVAAASMAGIALALLLESVQSYLPSRVPSNLDLLTNGSGMLIGALVGEAMRSPVLEQSRLRELRRAWFSEQASRGLIVVALWPLAQIFPQPYLFGHGQLLGTVSRWVSAWLEAPIDLSQWLWTELGSGMEHYFPAEVIVTACGMTGAVLSLLCQTRRHAPKTLLAITLLMAALGVKTLAHALLFDPDDALGWLTPSASSGLLIGIVMLAGLSFAPPLAQRRAAIFALALGLGVMNIMPANPYFMSTLQEWVQGRFLNFNGAAHFLSLTWPLFALWFLTHSSQRSTPQSARHEV
ncbi:MAG: VanZ family protein [Oxalobacteraceae bacterium]